MNYEPIEVAIALSLYGYNLSAMHRADRLHGHFQGKCEEPDDLLSMAFPAAELYVQNALEKYGEDARMRVRINRVPVEKALAEFRLNQSIRENHERRRRKPDIETI